MPLAEARLLAIELERFRAVLLAVRANCGGWFVASIGVEVAEGTSVALVELLVAM